MNEEEHTAFIKKYPLQTLYFYLTGDCNLACRHCWIAPPYQKAGVSESGLDYDIFKSIIGEAKPLGLTSVKLTGGEPLIHPRITDILSFIKNEDLGLTIESNGTALTPAIASQIAASRHPFLSISLDGSNAETHEWVRGVPGCFEQAVRGVRFAVGAGIKTQIIMTLMRRNVGEIESLVALGERLGVASVKLNILQPTARGRTLFDQGECLTIEELVSLGSMIEKEMSQKASIPVIFGHPLAFQPMGSLFGNSQCGTCNIHHILGVLHDGSYALCGIGETTPEMVFGHAVRDNLSDLWSSNATLHTIRKDIPDALQGICSECAMKHLCMGSCIAQNFNSSQNILSANWYCDEAWKKGLFPSTRMQMIKTKK